MPIPPPLFTDERPTPSIDQEDEMIIRDEPLPLPNIIGLMHEMVAMFNYLKSMYQYHIIEHLFFVFRQQRKGDIVL
jgi:hypothetical protein